MDSGGRVDFHHQDYFGMTLPCLSHDYLNYSGGVDRFLTVSDCITAKHG
ncbi:hypothetical protein [Streptomyces sp. NPDC060031]